MSDLHTLDAAPAAPLPDLDRLVVDTAGCRVSVETPRGRLSLRARGDLAALETALGVPLPVRIGERTASEDGTREALRLGPDEVSLLVSPAEVAEIERACAAVYPDRPHSLVDVSGRETTFLVEGPLAMDLLAFGCPRDLARIPDGAGRRTVFDDVSVILWRDGVSRFRLDIWHSFAPHVRALLVTGCREMAAVG